MNIQKRNPAFTTIPEVVAHNVGRPIKDFLAKKSEYKIKNLGAVKARLTIAGNNNEPVNVFGDYDADGVCAVAILALTFEKMGWSYTVRLPKRMSEGYGLSPAMIDEVDSGLILTVDNGIVAFEAIDYAKSKGFDVIVLDHHLASDDGKLPNADIIVDPAAIPDSADFNGYCGAGIAYKLAELILGKNDPLTRELMSLAAVATVADVMPLTDENRFIVKEGLVNMLERNGAPNGLRALLSEAKFIRHISAKDIGFKIAPMLNAPGRMYDDGAMASYELLSENGNDFSDAIAKANKLNEINEERKAVKNEELKIIEDNISFNCLYGNCPLIVYQEGLHEGLVGIYAGQLAEKYCVPCFVLTNSDESGILKGSGRTFGDVHLKDMLDKHSDLLYKYGGHAEAAGISVRMSQFEEFVNALTEYCEKFDFSPASKPIEYDIEIDATQIPETLETLNEYAPFGQGNPDIVFYIKNFTVANTPTFLQGGKSVKFSNGYASAICFDMGEKYEMMGKPKVIDLVGTLSINSFLNNVTNQIEVLEIIDATPKTTKTSFASLLESKSKARYS